VVPSPSNSLSYFAIASAVVVVTIEGACLHPEIGSDSASAAAWD